MKRWLILLLVAWQVNADFAGVDGFSGQYGATCVSCHVMQHPEPATAHLEGLPEAWDWDATYRITVRVTGGPLAAPDPAPKGGFEISSDGGAFSIIPGDEDLLRQPTNMSITYRPAGTLMREWHMDWHSPIAGKPQDVRFWLAVVSANGNHNAELNISDGGERLDSVATLQHTLPASDEAVSAYLATPLLPPSIESIALEDGILLEGRHNDVLADTLAYRFDGAWQSRPTASVWRLHIPEPAPGQYALQLQSQGDGRFSDIVTLPITVSNDEIVVESPAKDAPLSLWPCLLAMGLLLCSRRTSRSP